MLSSVTNLVSKAAPLCSRAISTTSATTKTKIFRDMLTSDKLEFVMEAHNGMSAKIVEEAGFKAIWASGLSMSASLGVRDSNEASWTQVLDVCEYMSDATNIPILLDGDTGFGNFNNARRLVRKLEHRGVAAVCLEDKLFPKTNSFIDVEGGQPLADITEFSAKITACKDAQQDPNFSVVARVESLIAGWPLEEALTRAHSYADAGADAVLVHSKIKTSEQIDAFMKEWKRDTPIVIVPTKYYNTPTEHFKDIGVSTVIWANHNCRAAVTAMQEITREIYEKQHLMDVESGIATVNELFRLQNEAELREAEKVYLP